MTTSAAAATTTTTATITAITTTKVSKIITIDTNVTTRADQTPIPLAVFGRRSYLNNTAEFLETMPVTHYFHEGRAASCIATQKIPCIL
jgi:hypothetical protein